VSHKQKEDILCQVQGSKSSPVLINACSVSPSDRCSFGGVCEVSPEFCPRNVQQRKAHAKQLTLSRRAARRANQAEQLPLLSSTSNDHGRGDIHSAANDDTVLRLSAAGFLSDVAGSYLVYPDYACSPVCYAASSSGENCGLDHAAAFRFIICSLSVTGFDSPLFGGRRGF